MSISQTMTAPRSRRDRLVGTLSQAARIELAAQEAKAAAGAAAVALPSPEKPPVLDSEGGAGPWAVKQRSLFRSDSAARLNTQQGVRRSRELLHQPQAQHEHLTLSQHANPQSL